MKKIQQQINQIKKSIINQNITNASMSTYGKLKEIEHSLYRYDQLSKAGLNKDARAESKRANNLISNFNAAEEGPVLEGYISNTRYVWVTEDDACEECLALDGTEYESEEDIPEAPHPNCKCRIEIFTGENEDGDSDGNGGNSDDGSGKDNGGGTNDKKGGGEPCDCLERLDALIQELEENASDLESIDEEAQADSENVETMMSHVENMIEEMNEALEFLGEEYGQHLAECENNIDAFYDEILAFKEKLQNLLTDILDLLDTIKSYLQVLAIFISNFAALQYEAYILREEMDKYRHSVANCQSAQLGEFEEEVAKTLSDKKEMFDQYKNIYAITHRKSEEEALADSERDQIANRLGRERGRNNPTCDCHILMQDLKPTKKK